MKKNFLKLIKDKRLILALSFPFLMAYTFAQQTKVQNTTEQRNTKKIATAHQINSTTIEVIFEDNQRLTFDFYNNNIFRLFQDINGGIIRDPEAKPEAKILVDQPRQKIENLSVKDTGTEILISTDLISVSLNKST